MSTESFFDDLDRGFIMLASDISYGFRKVCIDLSNGVLGKTVEDTASKTQEIASQFFLTLAALTSVCFAGTYIAITGAALCSGTLILRAIGFALQKNNYTEVKGHAPEVSLPSGEVKLMTLNVRGKENAIEHRLNHWQQRLSDIQSDIERAKPNVLHLQEVYDEQFAEALMPSLQAQFSHIIYLAGKNTFGNTSGSLLATNLSIAKCISRDFSNNNFAINRGVLLMEMKANPEDEKPAFRILATQLTEDDAKLRADQMKETLALLEERSDPLPTFFIGSLSVDRDSEEGKTLSYSLAHSYQGAEPTHPEGIKNFISLFKCSRDTRLPVTEKGISLVSSKLVEGLGTDNHAVFSTISGLKKS